MAKGIEEGEVTKSIKIAKKMLMKKKLDRRNI